MEFFLVHVDFGKAGQALFAKSGRSVLREGILKISFGQVIPFKSGITFTQLKIYVAQTGGFNAMGIDFDECPLEIVDASFGYFPAFVQLTNFLKHGHLLDLVVGFLVEIQCLKKSPQCIPQFRFLLKFQGLPDQFSRTAFIHQNFFRFPDIVFDAIGI